MFSIEGKIDLGLPRHFKNQDFFIDTFSLKFCQTNNRLKASTTIPIPVHYTEPSGCRSSDYGLMFEIETITVRDLLPCAGVRSSGKT